MKQDLDRWLKAVKRILPGLLYLWVLEFQKRGVPHFHVFLSAAADPGTEKQKSMAAAWVRITQGTPEQEKWHCRPSNWIEWKMADSRYVLKEYAVKEAQKTYLPTTRTWAGFGDALVTSCRLP